jgi:hypothetical protein
MTPGGLDHHTRYNPRTRLCLPDLSQLRAADRRPMRGRYHGMTASICEAQPDRDTQIEDDPIYR